MMKRNCLLLLVSMLLAFHTNVVVAQGSTKLLIDDNWLFSLGNHEGANAKTFNDKQWRRVDLPHDWSIEGHVDKDEPAGNDGGYFPTGTGWYRKHLKLSASECKGKRLYLYFEGVYMDPVVYVNGQKVGGHAYGYSPFLCDITDAVKVGGDNVVAVRVDNSKQKNCRWYSGSGIYRHVWLMVKAPVHFKLWGLRVTTPQVNRQQSKVNMEATVVNTTPQERTLTVTFAIGEGRKESEDVVIPAGKELVVTHEMTVDNPQLWDIDNPYLYTAHVEVSEKGRLLDRLDQSFGIRDMQVSTQGFFLNGRKVLLYGGCVHHDNGILGAASYDRAEERKVEMLKQAGFNAVRTSHNIPSEAFLDACDRLGMLVVDEAFDGWREAKNKYDYSTIFDSCWVEDTKTMVLRDRNHPSIFCWSIGNEVIERKKIEVVTTAHKLASLVHELDNRPVTSALASWDKDWEIYDPLAAELDITGYNYLIHKAPSDHERVSGRIMMQTESYPRDALRNWKMASEHDYVLGDFVWTAIDYLGESGIGRYWYEGEAPGEHYERPLYPCHAAYCGDIDLTGWRKPISHYRSILFAGNEKLYMAVREPDCYYGKIHAGLWAVWPTWESWNWPGHEGKNIEVEVDSRYPEVKLYLNGQLIGQKAVGYESGFRAVFTVPYQPGELKVEALENGKVTESRILTTAGEAKALRLTADRQTLKADGEDLAFITLEVVDGEGRLCPLAEDSLQMTVTGAGKLLALGNANIKDTGSYADGTHKAWKGRALAVVRSNRRKGVVHIRVSSPRLGKKEITLRCQ